MPEGWRELCTPLTASTPSIAFEVRGYAVKAVANVENMV